MGAQRYSQIIPLPPAAIRRTGPLFIVLCLYIIAHSFMIPIAAVGPSWSVWPTLADIIIVPLIGIAILGFRSTTALTPLHRRCLRSFGVLLGIALFALLHTIVFTTEREAVMYGLYFFYRFTEFFLLFWAVSQVAWSTKRLTIIGWVVDIVLLITCAGVLLTFFGIIPLSNLVAHLPQSPDLAGPWVAYPLKEKFPDDGRGVGFVGYNHAYAGVQILALVALRCALTQSRVTMGAILLLMIAVVSSFVTESRAGFAALIFFLATQFARNPKLLVAAMPLVLTAVVMFGRDMGAVSETVARQQTILSATDGDNLSGRPDIWRAYTEVLLNNPSYILVGAGLGASYPVTPNRSCHMTPLQYLFELGLIGFLAYWFIVFQIALLLYRFESGTKPLFFALVALQVASFTMETFYPIPYLGHFLGLCLFAIAVSFSKSQLRLPNRH